MNSRGSGSNDAVAACDCVCVTTGNGAFVGESAASRGRLVGLLFGELVADVAMADVVADVVAIVGSIVAACVADGFVVPGLPADVEGGEFDSPRSCLARNTLNAARS